MPAPVFYSISPFGTGTIETGAGNITITSGVATLTVEQTGNIGVGVDIEYNSLHCYIAPNRIGFDSGGTIELKVDTKIEDATSGATGIVRFVELLSGTWAGGDAAGWIYFEKTTGTFGNNNVINRTKPTASANIATVDGTIEGNIGNGNTEFVVKSAIGADAADQTVTAVTSIHHEYASLATFEAGFTDASHINEVANGDLTNADVVAHACCYYDHDNQTPDSTETTIDFGTTDATRYLIIFTPTSNAESINNQRHSGIWDTNKWYFKAASRLESWVSNIAENYTVVEGLQMTGTPTSTADSDNIISDLTGTNVIIRSCISWCVEDTGHYARRMLLIANGGGSVKFINCVFYSFSLGGIEDSYQTVTVDIYHCTISGIVADAIERNSGTFTCINNAVFNNGDDYDGTVTVTYSASDDTQAGTGNIDWDSGSTDWGNVFTDYSADPPDFSLKDYTTADIALIEQGTSLAASQGIWRDIAGTERGATPDIGAFEYVAAGGTVTGLLSGKLIIKSAATNLLDGKAAIESGVSGALDGKVIVFLTDTDTLDGKAHLVSKATDSLDGKALVFAIDTDLLDGKVILQTTATNLLDGKTIIGSKATDLLDGKATVKNTATVLLDGKVIIGSESTDLLDGKAVVKNTATVLLDGKLITSLSTDATDLLDGKTIIKSIATNLLDGKSEIESGVSGALDGKAVIRLTVADSLDGKTTVKITTADMLDGKATISNSATDNLDGLLMVTVSVTDDLDGKITLKDTAIGLLDGQVSVSTDVADNLDGKVIIKSSAIETLDGKITIPFQTSDNLDGKIVIKNNASVLLDGKITISTAVVNTLDGKLYILGTGEGLSLLDGQLKIRNFFPGAAMMLKT